MSLLNRKPRPLTRETSDYRDDRLFIVACDDRYAPAQYFDFFRIERVKIHVIPTEDCTSHATHVLERLLSVEHREDDELWLLLDTDHCIQSGHVKSFVGALREAKQKGVNIALSRSCFEVWLLLHHLEADEVAPLGNAGAVENKLKEVLGSYNKTMLRGADFSLSSVVTACTRASELDQMSGHGLVPKTTTSRVYKLWQSIVDGASVSQLPEEILALRKK